MTLICNKKNENKNEERKLIIVKNEVLHNTNKQASNFLFISFKRRQHEMILVHCDSAFCQNLEGMVS